MAFAISLSWILILEAKKHKQLCIGHVLSSILATFFVGHQISTMAAKVSSGETDCTWWLGSQTVVGHKQSSLKDHQDDQIKLICTDFLLIFLSLSLKCWPSCYSSKTCEDSACFRSFQMLRIMIIWSFLYATAPPKTQAFHRSHSNEVSIFTIQSFSSNLCTDPLHQPTVSQLPIPSAPTARLQRPNPVAINLVAIQACALETDVQRCAFKPRFLIKQIVNSSGFWWYTVYTFWYLYVYIYLVSTDSTDGRVPTKGRINNCKDCSWRQVRGNFVSYWTRHSISISSKVRFKDNLNRFQHWTSWWFHSFNPFEKYARQIGAFPQWGNIKNVWNQQLVEGLTKKIRSLATFRNAQARRFFWVFLHSTWKDFPLQLLLRCLHVA